MKSPVSPYGTLLRRAALALILPVVIGSMAVSAATFSQQQAQLSAEAFGRASDFFGWSVAISGDTAVVGAREDSGKGDHLNGSVYVYVRAGTTWTLQQRLAASNGAASDRFGHSVAISGNTVIVGTLNGFDTGKAYIFVRNGTTWTQQQQLAPSDPVVGSRFGISVSLSGETAIVGAQGFAAYVFTRSNGTWTQQAKLSPPVPAAPGYFGWSVGLSKNTAVVGDLADQGKGSATVFVRQGTSWTQQKRIFASDATPGDRFGYSVGIDADSIVVGSNNSDVQNYPFRQFASVFVRGAGSWPKQATLSPTVLKANDGFGQTVAISGDTVVVGARGSSSNSAAAYVFARSGVGWSAAPVPKLTASDGVLGDNFGFAVAVNGSTAIIGAPSHAVNGNIAQGKAYVFLDIDSDGDGLPDTWEKSGITVSDAGTVTVGNTGAGNGTFINLPAMGADAKHKDIFVHADWMAPNPAATAFKIKPPPRAMKVVSDAFLRAPVTNPDGKTGIRLHVDLGPDSVMNPVTGQKWGSFSKANEEAFQATLGSYVSATQVYDWSAFDVLKNEDYFGPSKRRPAFHYMIFCNNYDGLERSSGRSHDVPGVDFLVALGQIGGGTAVQQANTFMHELGHNLGLLHGGSEDVNYKPNYLSNMNYSFQMEGLPLLNGKRVLDYSRKALLPLDENALSESAGVGDVTYYTYWKKTAPAPPNDGYYKVLINGALDWNTNEILDSAPVAVDLNSDGNKTVLTGFNDWPALDFSGGGKIGDAAGSNRPEAGDSSPAEVSIDELLAVVPKRILDEEAVAPTDVATVTTQPASNGSLVATFNGSASTAVSGNIVSWVWDFGDGTTGTGATVAHTYNAPGEYYATLSVTDSVGRVNLIPLITVVTVDEVVTPTPTPTPTASPTATPSPTPVQGRYSFTKVVDNTQLFNGRQFDFVQTPPQMNDSRTVVFGAQVLSGPNHDLVDLGIFKMNPGGSPVGIVNFANGFQTLSQFGGFPFINSHGVVSVTGVNGSSASTDQGIFVGTGGPLTKIAGNSSGQPFLNFNNSATWINGSGTVAFRAELRDGTAGIFSGKGGAVTPVAGASGFAEVGNPAMNEAGTVVFSGRTKDFVRGVFTISGGASTTVADENDQFSSFGIHPTINLQGAVAFQAYRKDNSQGVFLASGGNTVTVADSNGAFSNFNQDASINDSGTVVFTALTKSGDPGIFTGPDPVLNKVIAVGDALFGGTVTAVSHFRGLNNNNEIAFVYRLDTKVNGLFVQGIAIASPRTVLANISTRMRVETGDNALIGGFIITGTQPKKLIVRAIGPALPLTGVLADPTLELHDSSGALLDSNDNWGDASNLPEIIASKIPPTRASESAIVRTVSPGAYTCVVRGASNTTGVGLVEVYDLDLTVDSRLANISTRGLVQSGDNVMIGGFIISGSAAQKVIVRAIGPSLPLQGSLADPVLELHDGDGALIETNDNWIDSTNKQAIIDSTIPPTNNSESAIVRTLKPGNYTAIIRGVNDTTGVALVEVYALP